MGGITGSPLFEVAIGLVLVWFAAATLCTGIVELVGTALGFKAKHLWRALGNLLNPTASAPTPPRAVTGAAQLAVLDARAQLASSPYVDFIRAVPGTTTTTIKRIKSITTDEAADAFLYAMESNPVEFQRTEIGQLFARLPESAQMTLDQKRKWFERTFDSQMVRLTEGYRSRIRWWAALFGLVIAFAFGLDSIGLTQRLYEDPAQRAVLIAEAEKVDGAGPTCEDDDGNEVECETLEDRLEAAREAAGDLTRLQVSVWQLEGDDQPDDCESWLRAVAGMLLTAAAIAAGAPFWFDVLRRLMGLRSGTSGSAT